MTVSENTKEKKIGLENLYRELDKGIDDMESGKLIPHEDAMQIVRERVDNYAV